MRVKLDENLPIELKHLFRQSGLDTDTVVDEGLGGASDAEVAAVCIDEERVLVSQDLDFSDIRTYPPSEYFGIVVFRLSTAARHALLGGGRHPDGATGTVIPNGPTLDRGRLTDPHPRVIHGHGRAVVGGR